MENNELFIERKNFMNGLIRLFKNDNFNTENGKVISIDGEWGIGKTFFKDKFKGELENEKFIVMEYNAWENDYEEDPFPSLVGNMVSQMESFNKSSDVEKVINNIKTNSLKILKELMPVLVVGLAKYFGVEEVFKIFEEAKEGTKIITKNITEIIFDYNKKEKTIEDFKNSMSDFRIEYTQYKQSLEIDSPERRSKVIILIDELDRCKPNYALKVLERIKHFFNIPDYIFVFLNNKKQIESTVNSIYGIKNGDVYLEKFYDLELNLPVPDKKEFINMLIENNFENSDYDLFERFLFDAFKFYFVDSDLSLRVIEKSFIYYKTIVDLKPNFRTFFETLSFPLFFFEKIFNKDI